MLLLAQHYFDILMMLKIGTSIFLTVQTKINMFDVLPYKTRTIFGYAINLILVRHIGLHGYTILLNRQMRNFVGFCVCADRFII